MDLLYVVILGGMPATLLFAQLIRRERAAERCWIYAISVWNLLTLTIGAVQKFHWHEFSPQVLSVLSHLVLLFAAVQLWWLTFRNARHQRTAERWR